MRYLITVTAFAWLRDVLISNHGIVDPESRVTRKLDSHVELFSRWKANLGGAPEPYNIWGLNRDNSWKSLNEALYWSRYWHQNNTQEKR